MTERKNRLNNGDREFVVKGETGLILHRHHSYGMAWRNAMKRAGEQPRGIATVVDKDGEVDRFSSQGLLKD